MIYLIKTTIHIIDSTIKMKPVDLKSSTYIDFVKENIERDSKFETGDIGRISKYREIFPKGYIPNWSEEVLVIKKVKSNVPCTYFINILNGVEIVGTFYKKELQKANQKNLELKKQ